MARDFFTDVILHRNADTGAVTAIGNVSIDVYKLDANGARLAQRPTLYQGRTGGAAYTNPIVTTNGSFEFFADPGEYEIVFTDLDVPARIAQKSIWWSSIPGTEAGIPASQLPDRGEGLIQPGDIIFCGYADPGAGYVLAAGQYVTRLDPYDRVYARYGTAFNLAGDTDNTKFRLPDFRGRAPFGWGDPTGNTGGHADMNTIGKNDGLALNIRRPKHKHGRGNLDVAIAGGDHYHALDPDGTFYHVPMGTTTWLKTNIKLGTGSDVDVLSADNQSTIKTRQGTSTASHSHSSSLSGEIGATSDLTNQPIDIVPYLVCMFKIKL
jgi:hypothetical protein